MSKVEGKIGKIERWGPDGVLMGIRLLKIKDDDDDDNDDDEGKIGKFERWGPGGVPEDTRPLRSDLDRNQGATSTLRMSVLGSKMALQ